MEPRPISSGGSETQESDQNDHQDQSSQASSSNESAISALTPLLIDSSGQKVPIYQFKYETQDLPTSTAASEPFVQYTTLSPASTSSTYSLLQPQSEYLQSSSGPIRLQQTTKRSAPYSTSNVHILRALNGPRLQQAQPLKVLNPADISLYTEDINSEAHYSTEEIGRPPREAPRILQSAQSQNHYRIGDHWVIPDQKHNQAQYAQGYLQPSVYGTSNQIQYYQDSPRPRSGSFGSASTASNDSVYSRGQESDWHCMNSSLNYGRMGKTRLIRRRKDEEHLFPTHPRPTFSYASLIGMALKNSPNGCLTVSDIYAFVTENFPYYRSARSGWKNSIRHNLSMNKCFYKVELVDDKGNLDTMARKACLWALNPDKLKKMDADISKHINSENIIGLARQEDMTAIINGTKGMPTNVTERRYERIPEEVEYAYGASSQYDSSPSPLPHSVDASPESDHVNYFGNGAEAYFYDENTAPEMKLVGDRDIKYETAVL